MQTLSLLGNIRVYMGPDDMSILGYLHLLRTYASAYVSTRPFQRFQKDSYLPVTTMASVIAVTLYTLLHYITF